MVTLSIVKILHKLKAYKSTVRSLKMTSSQFLREIAYNENHKIISKTILWQHRPDWKSPKSWIFGIWMRRLFSEVEGDDIDEGEDEEEAGEAAEEHKIHLKI